MELLHRQSEEQEQDTQGLLDDDKSYRPQPSELEADLRGQIRRYAIRFYTLLAVTTVLALVLLWSLTRVRVLVRDPLLDLYSPLNHLVEYEDVVFYDNIHHFSPYQMPPDDDVDEMWSQLYNGTAFTRVNATAARMMPNATMMVPGSDGDGIVSIEMFHVLHCVNSLRKSLWPQRYPDYAVYYPNGTMNEDMITHHTHCIDRLRQNVMCAGNIGSIYVRWHEGVSPEDQSRWMLNMETTYRCRKFDKLREWARQRDYPDFDKVMFSPGELTA